MNSLVSCVGVQLYTLETANVNFQILTLNNVLCPSRVEADALLSLVDEARLEARSDTWDPVSSIREGSGGPSGPGVHSGDRHQSTKKKDVVCTVVISDWAIRLKW